MQAERNLPCEATVEGKVYPLATNQPTRIPVANPRLWSPDDPFLYPLTVRLGEDVAQSYFAMRSTSIQADSHGVRRLYLNGKPFFQNGLLDQGYWPDGLYTAPSDEALVFDIQTAKDLGFTMLRKHIKVEPMRWYYHCDCLGMPVWQDMPNGGGKYRFSTITLPLITGRHHNDHDYRRFAREAAEGREAYRRELAEMVNQLYSCPCVVLWVPFNEGWGQFDAADAARLIDKLDGTRPIDPASGWHDQRSGDLRTLHVYLKKYRFHRDRFRRAVALSEFGGYNLRVQGHTWTNVDFGYKKLKSPEALQAAYEALLTRRCCPPFPKGYAQPYIPSSRMWRMSSTVCLPMTEPCANCPPRRCGRSTESSRRQATGSGKRFTGLRTRKGSKGEAPLLPFRESTKQAFTPALFRGKPLRLTGFQCAHRLILSEGY